MTETNQTRAVAARGGYRCSQRQRLAERFEVPEAFLICERRTLLRLWRVLGGPCRIINLGVSGVCFANFGPRLAPGNVVRLNLQLPRRTGLRIKAQIVHTGAYPKTIGQQCGATFTSLDASLWRSLCDLHSEYGSTAAPVSGSGFKPQEPAPNVGGFVNAISPG